jgi:hypothetical protein
LNRETTGSPALTKRVFLRWFDKQWKGIACF